LNFVKIKNKSGSVMKKCENIFQELTGGTCSSTLGSHSRCYENKVKGIEKSKLN